MRFEEFEGDKVIAFAEIIYTKNETMYSTKEEVLILDRLVVFSDYRQKGLATKLMSRVLDFVKEYGTPNFYLVAQRLDSKTALSQDKLVDFYKKHGFELFNDNFGQCTKPMKRIM